MWITTYHRYDDRAAFHRACLAAGWSCHGNQDPELPRGVAMDLIGPLIGEPHVGPDGALERGDMLDGRYHVKLAWHAQSPHPAFARSQCAPPTPWRTWEYFPTSAAAEPAIHHRPGRAVPIQRPAPGAAFAAARMHA